MNRRLRLLRLSVVRVRFWIEAEVSRSLSDPVPLTAQHPHPSTPYTGSELPTEAPRDPLENLTRLNFRLRLPALVR